MNVSVFGLGYVGSVSAASFAADGHTVVGVDVNPDKPTIDEVRCDAVVEGKCLRNRPGSNEPM